MNRVLNKKLYVFFTVCVLVFLAFSPTVRSAEVFESSFYPAKVRDISDRAYEPVVADLLDHAEISIVISMYIMRPGEEGAVDLLMRDLEEALERGVLVEIYLNTKFSTKGEVEVLESEPFEILKRKGAKISHYSPTRRVHDKQIIVDDRFVVEGSHNWTVSALKSNYESTVLIDSPELAKVMLKRLRGLPLKNEKDPSQKRTYKEVGVLPADETVNLKKILLEDKNYLPMMVTDKSNRTMDTYLLLLAESRKTAKGEILQLSLEDLAYTLNLPDEWSNTAKRRQVIKTLRKLKSRYGLIDFAYSHGKDAKVVLKDLPGETFPVAGEFFNPKDLVSRSASADFVLLIKDLLDQEGKDINDLSMPELTKRFHVTKWGLSSGIKEIEG
ncbi:MAG: phospholipase D-like domain-containing protein [Candidatus Omnitrophota bacterium]